MAGALLPDLRLALWIIVVLIDNLAPDVGFWLPGKGATPMDSWPLAGLHLLERNQQVVIISLGESILLLGASLEAAGLGFGLIVTLRWLSFVHTTNTGEHAFSRDGDHTRLARSGLACAHGIMVAGAIVMAVAIEEIIAHPTDPAHAPTILVTVLGPAIFLLGSALFYRTMAVRVRLGYLVGFGGLLAVGMGVHLTHASGLVLCAGVLLVLIVLTFIAAHGSRS